MRLTIFYCLNILWVVTIFDEKITLPDHAKNCLCTTAMTEPARRHTYDMHYIPASTSWHRRQCFLLINRQTGQKSAKDSCRDDHTGLLFISYSTSTWRFDTFTISLVLGVLRNNQHRVTAKASWADHWRNTSQSVLRNISGLIGG